MRGGPAVRGRGTGCRSWFAKGHQNGGRMKPGEAPGGLFPWVPERVVAPAVPRGRRGLPGSAKGGCEPESCGRCPR